VSKIIVSLFIKRVHFYKYNAIYQDDVEKEEKNSSYKGEFSFDFKDDKEKRLFKTNFDSIFYMITGQVQLVSGRYASFYESIIKALKLGAIPYDYKNGKIVVCVPKENYIAVSKPSERIIIDDSEQDDDFDMVNTRDDYEASFDMEAYEKSNVGDVFAMGQIAGEEVYWKVLDIDPNDGSKLVIVTNVIDVKRFIELEGISRMRCIAWKESKLRKWLNNIFIDAIIPKDIQHNIKTVIIKNKQYMRPEEYNEQNIDLNDTVDKIFCLNVEEAKKYFCTDQDRIATATFYADKKVKRYAYNHFKNHKTEGVKWWLRDSIRGGAAARYNVVDGDGTISDYQLLSNAEGVGVRPAMWIKL